MSRFGSVSVCNVASSVCFCGVMCLFPATYDHNTLGPVFLTTIVTLVSHPCLFTVFIYRLHDSPSLVLTIPSDTSFDTVYMTDQQQDISVNDFTPTITRSSIHEEDASSLVILDKTPSQTIQISIYPHRHRFRNAFLRSYV
jgi:hypothetical protein